MSNTTNTPLTRGRFCNCLIRNIFSSLLAEKYNFKFSYNYYEQIEQLGIKLFTNGKNYYNGMIHVNDNDFFKYMYHEKLTTNIFTCYYYFQNYNLAHYLRFEYFNKPDIKSTIMNQNKYAERYNNNNDVFIHIRLGDVIEYSAGINYYEKALKSIEYNNGYIASDSLDHPICVELINKYNLIPINTDEVSTIMFGSTCKNIILSGGTFSWIIGVLGYFSNIYYEHPEKRKIIWFPIEIFKFDDWNMVDY
jgi:hypothetical protein